MTYDIKLLDLHLKKTDQFRSKKKSKRIGPVLSKHMYKERKARMKEISTNVVVHSTKLLVSAGLDKLSPTLYKAGIPVRYLDVAETSVAKKLARIISPAEKPKLRMR